MYWVQRLDCGPKRVNHAAVAVDNMIYSFGGYCSEEPFPAIIDTYIFNTVTLEWCRVLPVTLEWGRVLPSKEHMPPGLFGHSVVVYKGKIYLWGGVNGRSEANNKLYCFDLATLSWSSIETTGHLPLAMDGHSACVIGNCMYIFGGFDSYNEVLVNMLYKLDLEVFKWERVWAKGTAPSERDFHTASVIGTRMYIFGGRSYLANEEINEIYINEVMYFETTNNTWCKPFVAGDAPRGRRSHSAAVYNGEIYIIGGCSPEYSIELKHLNDVHKFNPEQNCWVAVFPKGTAPCPRRRHCCVVIGDKLYLFGGSSPLHHHYSGSHNTFPPRLKEESDMFIMDLCPTLKRLSMLKVIEYRFQNCQFYLPLELQEELTLLKKSESKIAFKTGEELLAFKS